MLTRTHTHTCTNTHTGCPKCPESGRVSADCANPRADNSDGTDSRTNFNYVDMDGNSHISFMERKFIASDGDFSGTISKNEWRLGDFPEAYGPFEGHANCSGSDTVSLYMYM